MSRPARLLGLLLLAPALASAQSGPAVPRQLTLARALEVARTASPTYRQSLNDADPAEVALRAARAGLFPTLSTSGGVGYTGAGRSTFGGSFFNQSSPALSSSYSIGAQWSISAATLMAPKQSQAELRATDQNIAAAKVNLDADVTTQYLTALRAVASVEVAEQQVKRNQEFLDIAKARFEVGRANLIDVRQAEVTKAQGDVQLLRARQGATEATIELLRRIGVPAGAIVDSLVLTEAFPLSSPTWELGELKRLALEANPSLKALEARREAASIGVRSARSAYLPSFQISSGLQGFTQQFTDENVLITNALGSAIGSANNCRFQNGILERLTSPHPAPNGGIIADCNSFAGLDATGAALDPQIRQSILDRNDVFPFNFSRQPWSISFGISLPIWDGFQRSTRISQARAQEDDAREQLRARQLELDGALQARLAGVRTAFEAARIQDVNRTAAREQLQLAQDRYRLGSGTALEVADAQNAVTRAEVDYVSAVYDYHLAVVALEASVGRPLR
jgi:outer membrane protein TolC